VPKDGNDDEVVSLDAHRVRVKEEFLNDIVTYVEALWGEETWAFNIAIQDLEKRRRKEGDKSLRPPETYHEIQQVILHIRALANEVARFYSLPEFIRKEDDFKP
jgi:hypothetical protein